MKNYSRQREEIIRIIKKLGNHPIAEQIYFTVKQEDTSISRSTVYRNLNDLVKNNVLLKIPVSQDAYTKIEGTNLQWTIDEGKLTIDRIDETITDENLNAMPDWYGDIHSPWYNNSEITSVQIKDGVTNIGSDAFKGCSGLTSIAIPNSVTSFGGNAFNGCSELTSITIPSGVTEIDNSAFENWSGLTSITIPSGVTEIGCNAFMNCSALTSITIPASVTSISSGVRATI